MVLSTVALVGSQTVAALSGTNAGAQVILADQANSQELLQAKVEQKQKESEEQTGEENVEDTAESPEEIAIPNTIQMTADTDVWIREAAGATNASPIGLLHEDESITVYTSEITNDWVRVQMTNGNDGYIHKAYLHSSTDNDEEILQACIAAAEEEAATQAEASVQIQQGQAYSVNGAVLDTNLQAYIKQSCDNLGIGDYFPQILCQMYQESRFNQGAVSPHDCYGLMQLKGAYHEAFKAAVGHPEWDLVNDPYANAYVGVFLMSQYIHAYNGDFNMALTDYYWGGGTAANNGIYQEYVDQVRQWEATAAPIP